MCLLYRVGDDVIIEMSREAWAHVQESIDNYLAECEPINGTPLETELRCYSNAVRSHIQHLDADVLAGDRSVKGGIGPSLDGARQDVTDNMDLM